MSDHTQPEGRRIEWESPETDNECTGSARFDADGDLVMQQQYEDEVVIVPRRHVPALARLLLSAMTDDERRKVVEGAT